MKTSYAEQRLAAIGIALSKAKVVFSKTTSARLVGGRTRLYRLIEEGKIRIEKPAEAPNGKWHCNAMDILRNVKF